MIKIFFHHRESVASFQTEMPVVPGNGATVAIQDPDDELIYHYFRVSTVEYVYSKDGDFSHVGIDIVKQVMKSNGKN